MKIEFDSKLVYGDDDKYIKTKIKTYGDSAITNFYCKKILKEKAPCKCFLIVMLDSVIKERKIIVLKHFLKNANMYKKR